MSSPFLLPLEALPGISSQLQTAKALADAGVLTAEAGLEGFRALDAKPPQGWVQAGRIDLTSLRRAAVPLRLASARAHTAARAIEAAPKTYLIPPLARARQRAEEAVGSASESARRAAAAVTAAPQLVGADEPKRYLLLFSNLAELRGTGGLYGFDATLTADGGRLTIGDPGRPREHHELIRRASRIAPDWFRRTWDYFGALELWTNVNATPDFPTVARIAAEARRMDGVIQIDGRGIAALLRLTGPLTLRSWPEPVNADNVLRVAHNEVYLRYTDEPRRDIFGEELIDAVFRKLFSQDLQVNANTLDVLTKAALGGHIQVFANEPAQQQAVVDLGLSGGLARSGGATDVLGVYNLNTDESKQDFFLHRTVSYDVRLDPITNSSRAVLNVTLRDVMPESGMTEYVTGPGKRELTPGENRTILMLIHPKNTQLTSVTVDRRPADVYSGDEAHMRSDQIEVVVPARGQTRVQATLLSPASIRGEGRNRAYRLFILHQPVLNEDRYEVHMNAPPGWRARPDALAKPLSGDVLLRVEFKQSLVAWLGHQILRPVRALQRLF